MALYSLDGASKSFQRGPSVRRGARLVGKLRFVRAAALVGALVLVLSLPLAGTAAPALLVGDLTVEANADSNTAGTAEAFQTTAAVSGLVSDLRVYVDSTPPSKLSVGLYANSAGHPGALLAQGTSAAPTASSWNDVLLTSSTSVTAGTVYWIAVLAPSGSGTVHFRDRAGAGSSETSSLTTLAALPTTWKTGTHYTDGPLSAYALASADTTPPSQPAGFVSVGVTASSVSTSWSASSDDVGVAGYDVYVNGQKVGTSSAASHTFGSLVCNTSYTFAVDAYDAAGNVSGPASLTAATAACPDATPPSQPSAFVASGATASTISTSWSASSDDTGGTGYSLYANGQKVGTASSASYTFSGLACGTGFALGVEAYDAAGNVSPRTALSASTSACSDTTPPSSPSGVMVSGSTGTTVSLLWTASSDNVGVAGYDAFVGSQKAGSTTATSYTFYGLQCGQVYTVGVDAYDAADDVSLRTDVTAATAACPDNTPPTAPGRFAAGSSTVNSVSTSWTASTDNVGVSGYNLYLNAQKVGATSATSYVFSGLTCGTSYVFGVEATDAAGNVSSRATLTSSTSACPDTTPPTVSVTSPAPSATVSGVTTLGANASDNVGVASLQFNVDGNTVGSPVTSAPFSWSWDSRGVANGSHAITATARDAAGNVTMSAGVTVTVSNALSGSVVLGDQTIETHADSNPSGVSEAFRTTATAGGTVTLLKVYVSATAPTKLVAGLYNDASEHPGTLLGQGSLTSPAGGTWNTVGLSPGVSVTSGSTYWIAVLAPSGAGTLRFVDKLNGGASETFATIGVTTLPTTWRTGVRYTDGSLSAYGLSSATDTTPPTAPSSLTISGSSASSLSLAWAASSDNTGVAGYDVLLNGSRLTSTPGTSYTFASLSCGTSYTLGVDAYDASANVSSRTSLQAPTASCDSVPPSASISSPSDGASVSGSVTLGANASDDVGLASVQFQVDGVNVGSLVTASPYTWTWDTRTVSNASHAITAIARDAAGNSTRSAPVIVTVSNALDGSNAFKVIDIGPGYVDASVRQVIRTAGDRVYIFAADDTAQRQGTGPGVIRAWKAATVGIPTAFSEVDGAHRPTADTSAHILTSPDVRLDRNGLVHLLYVAMLAGSGNLVYQTFDPATDTWGAKEIVDTGVRTPSGSIAREPEDTLVLDAQDALQAVYVKGSSLLYRNRSAGVWSPPTTVASGGALIHPSLAAGPDGSLRLAWLSDGTTPSIWYAEKPVAGPWSAPEAVAVTDVLTNSNLDQTPSIVVTSDGVSYVNYIGAQQITSGGQPFGAFRVRHRVGPGQWADDTPATQFYTHTPQIYSRGQDLYVFLGHDVNFNMGYVDRLAGQAWSAFNRLSTFSADGSASVRWDPLRDNNPAVIDEADFNEDRLHNGSYLPELYYIAVLPSQ